MSTRRDFLRYAELTGTPFERGLAHGETFSDEIATNLETYVQWFGHRGRDRDALVEHGQRYLDLIESQNEAYATEMEGVAEGSGYDVAEISMLNARYEAMYPANVEEYFTDDEDATFQGGCSTYAVQPEVTADGRAYLGQNWDWLPDLENIVIGTVRDDGPNMVYMTEAGIVGGKTGVNEHGIGLGVNGLFSKNDGNHLDRKPFHVRCWEILDADRSTGHYSRSSRRTACARRTSCWATPKASSSISRRRQTR
jgi:isopenicillin-N N-acyltransferase-like protein